jgi:hypothetical protein
VAPSGLRSKYVARLEFRATNNIAEYEGHILGLNKAKALGAPTLLIIRFSSCDRPSGERIHGMRARASKVFVLGKSLRAEILGFHPETHTKIRKFQS